MEKAWAKAHGSYANIVAGNPIEVFKAVTYAPSEMIFVKESEEEREKLWRIILDYAVKDYPCCCGTDDREDVDWEQINLIPSHAYTLVIFSLRRLMQELYNIKMENNIEC